MSHPVAIVTGASSGIGLALTRLLLQRGWRVAMADLQTPAPTAIPNEHRDSHMFVQTNVSVFDEQKSLFAKAFEWGGQRLDFLAANAGMMDSADIYQKTESPPEKAIDTTVFRVNTEAAVQGLYLFTHYARRNAKVGGKVVLTSSSVALYGQDTIPMYTAAKLALVGLTMGCSKRYIKENITVNVICPSLIATGMAPKRLWDLWPAEHVTPMSTALRAYEMILDDDQLNGQVLELSQDQVFRRENKWSYPNASQKWVAEESLPLLHKAVQETR